MRNLRNLLLVATVASAADLDHIVAALRPEVRPEAAMERMQRIYSTDRWFTFPKFHETTRYVASQMKDAGLEQIEVGGAKADGKSQAGYWTMPLAWDVRTATLEIIEPSVPQAERILVDYQKIPASLGMWSGPTPPGGIEAELVEIKAANVARHDLKGKIVLMSDPRSVKAELAKAGAVGAVNTFTENEELRDGYQWMNGWGDKGWAFNAGDSPLVSFSLSPSKRDYVRSLLVKGPVKVRARVDSRYYEDVYPWVTGIIPGTDGSEDVLLLGHASEQGAHDNATGVSAMIEAMAAINRLVKAGKIERPRRSIRLLVMGEMYGSMDYIAKHPARIRNTVAAMCLDTPAAAYEISGTEYSFYMNPHVAASWVDAFILRVAEAYFPLVRRIWHEKPHTPGTDTFLADPLIGVPTTWAYSGSGVETHHNSEDTPDRVDKRSLRDVSVVTAAFLYYAASAGSPDAQWLTQLVLTRAYQQMTAAAARSVGEFLKERTQQALAEGIARIRYSADRQKQALTSISRIAPGRVDVTAIEKFEADQIARLRAVAGNMTPGDVATNPDAKDIIVVRKRFGTLPLDDLPVDRREGFPSGAWSVRLITAVYWCDGKRSLDEVIRLTRLELGPDKFDWIGYFRFLEKNGYVTIRGLSKDVAGL